MQSHAAVHGVSKMARKQVSVSHQQDICWYTARRRTPAYQSGSEAAQYYDQWHISINFDKQKIMICNWIGTSVMLIHCSAMHNTEYTCKMVMYIQNKWHYPEAPWHRPRPPSLPLRQRGQGYGPNQRSPGTTWLPGASCDAAAAPLALCSLFPSSGWGGKQKRSWDLRGAEEQMVKQNWITIYWHILTCDFFIVHCCQLFFIYSPTFKKHLKVECEAIIIHSNMLPASVKYTNMFL